MLLYPLYSSMRAIESPTTLDDQQWLTYWVIHSLLALFELSSWKVLQWVPIWGYVKLLLCMWLVLPGFNGAAFIYENYVRKYFMLGGLHSNSTYPDTQRRVMRMMSLDARKSVETYIHNYGLQAFERVLRAVSYLA
ncbi:hypothetical protein V2J09_009383 [Rumex salicifolius]